MNPFEGALRKRSPFFSWHVAHGATLYEKGGWVRPARYQEGAVAEHLRVRRSGGIIDAHSMGKVTVTGAGATALLEIASTNTIATTRTGGARYTCLCNEDGGILDDVIVYRTGPDSYYLITNTLSREKVVDFLRGLAGSDVCVHDVSSATAYIAVQGPETRTLLTRCGVEGELDNASLPYFGCLQTTMSGVPLLLARTGYTGELGYELNFPAEYAMDVWERLCDVGAELDIGPVGAEAMMSLRLEKGYRSYGADIDQGVNPVEAGLGWVVDWKKADFFGRAALVAARSGGVARRAVCLKGHDGVHIARGDKLTTVSGELVGEVTSGLFGPSLDAYVGLGYLDSAVAEPAGLIVAGTDGGPVSYGTRPFFDPAGERLRQ